MYEYLTELSDVQLREVAASLEAKIKDAKKKAMQALSKNEALLKNWIATMSSVPTGPVDEGTEDIVRRARDDRRKAFEKTLIACPDAFILYHMAEYLRTLAEAVRKERTARSATAPKPSKT